MYNPIFKALSVCLIAVAASASFGLDDPTRPSGYTAAATQQILQLDSVLISPSRKVAVINGTAVSVGEKVAGATVLAIGEQQVKLSRDGKHIVLKPRITTIRQVQ